MSRTKRKESKPQKPSTPQHHDHDQVESQDHPVEPRRARARIGRPARTKMAKGVDTQRRSSYGYRTSPRQGG